MTDIKTFDLNLLKALDALLVERSVTRAASRLNLSQPAVSGMLARLREAFADPLFVRGQRGIVPTERALQLAAPLRQALDELDSLFQPPIFDPSSARGTWRIAATDYALHTLALPCLSRLRSLAPGIRVSVQPVPEVELGAWFDNGDLDLALTTPQMAPGSLRSRHLFDEHYVVAMRADHPVAGALPDLDTFCALDHALVSLGGDDFSGVTDTALAAIGRSRRVQASLGSFQALADLLRTTDLVTVAPSRLFRHAPGIVAYPPPIDVPGFSKIAVWHERSHRDPTQGWLRALLFQQAAGDAPPSSPLADNA